MGLVAGSARSSSAVDGLAQRAVIGAAHAADRRRTARFLEPGGVLQRHALDPAVAVMD